MKSHHKLYFLIIGLVVSFVTSSFRFHGFSADIANLLLGSLDDSQKAKLFTGFEDDKRFEWTYLPPYQVPRNGLPLKEMTQDQKELVAQLLSTSLSEAGYNKVKLIMSLEEILAELENNPQRDPECILCQFTVSPTEFSLGLGSFKGII